MTQVIRRSVLGWVVWAVLALSLNGHAQPVAPVLAGAYSCMGMELDGSDYTIPTEIVVRGPAVLMTWGTNRPQDQRLYGLGMLHRGVLSVAYRDVSGQFTGIVVYDVLGSVLDGRQMVFSAIGQITPERCSLADTKVAGLR